MSLAEKITELRKKQGWSQIELADRLDVSRQSVSKWEMGQAVPELDKIIKMSELFSVTTDHLLKENVPGPETPPIPQPEGETVPPEPERAVSSDVEQVREEEHRGKHWSVAAAALLTVAVFAAMFSVLFRGEKGAAAGDDRSAPGLTALVETGTAAPTPVPASAGAPEATTVPAPADAPTAPTETAGSGLITLDAAKADALADAGLIAEDVTFTKTKADRDDGMSVYDIEFQTGTARYEYELSAADGAIREKSVKFRGVSASAGEPMDADRAREIALGDTGLAEADVRFGKTELDRDDGRTVYEVELYADGAEYDYTIDAVSGDILEYSVDMRTPR